MMPKVRAKRNSIRSCIPRWRHVVQRERLAVQMAQAPISVVDILEYETPTR